MTEPRQLLAIELDAAINAQESADPMRVDANVYGQPPASSALAAPAMVIRTDNPWMRPADRDQPFGKLGERYAVVCVVQASGDAIDQLRRLVRLAMAPETPWRWTQTDGIVQATEGGIDYLAATVRLTYQSTEREL